MDDPLKQMRARVEDEVVKQALSGEGRGIISKLILGFADILLTILAVNLLKESHYVCFAIALLGFTPLSIYVFIGLGVYLAFEHAWIPSLWLGASLLMELAAVFVGNSFIRQNIRCGRPSIDADDGTFREFFLTTLCAFLAIALLTKSLISFAAVCLFILVGLIYAVVLYQRVSSNWAKIHFSLMNRYAREAALVNVLAERQGKEFDLERALRNLLKTVFTEEDDAVLEAIIRRANAKRIRFIDRKAIEDRMFANHKLSAEKREELMKLLDELAFSLSAPPGAAAYAVRYTIAEVVGYLYGESERINYLLAVITNHAK